MPTETQVRTAIVSAARDLIGSHYLAGTFGAIPNVTDTFALDRSVAGVTDLAWETIGLHTCEITYEGRTLRCCGRYAAVGGSSNRWPRLLPPPSGDFGAWLTTTIAALRAQPRGSRVLFAGFGNNLYPRRHCFAAHGDAEDPELVYLGEACAGKHHFDCVGFVCRVLTNALGRPIRYGLPGRFGAGNWIQDGNTSADGREAANRVRAQPGDLLVSSSHIAMVYERSRTLRIIHANGDRNGVHITNFNDGDSTWQKNFHVVYLSPRFLRATPDVAVAAAS